MLLFYEDEPDSTEVTQSTYITETTQTQRIDPLPHYGSHAFIPYLPKSQPVNAQHNTPSSPKTIKQPPLEVYNASTWSYCGPLLTPHSSALPPSFHTWASTTLSSPSILLHRLLPLLSFLHSFFSAAGAQHYWLTLRATRPTHDYNTTRWHTDANFFDTDPEQNGMGFSPSSKNRCWKLATTLLGPRTLFLKDNAYALDMLRKTKLHERENMAGHTCTSIRCLGCSTSSESIRHRLAHSLAGQETESPVSGEVAFFRIGDDEGAVHSEPRCDVDRIFVNVIPGTEVDLKGLMGRWGMGYPRAWCFGVPVGFVSSDEKEDFGGVGEEKGRVVE